jgi:hypothetical protein
MTTRALAHRVPTVAVSFTVTVNADKTLLFVAGLAWLAWLHLARLGRFIGGVWSWLGAAGRVIRRRWSNWKREMARRIEWQFYGLVYGPVMGVG